MIDALSEKIQELTSERKTELRKRTEKAFDPCYGSCRIPVQRTGQSGWNFKVYAGMASMRFPDRYMLNPGMTSGSGWIRGYLQNLWIKNGLKSAPSGTV